MLVLYGVHIPAFHDQYCLCASEAYSMHRSSASGAYPKDLHFSTLTEALKPKLFIYLI